MNTLRTLRGWFDKKVPESDQHTVHSVDYLGAIPFFLVHLACIAIIWVGASWVAVVVGLVAYYARMFAITAFYHRYFSHRSFKTSRPAQFIFAMVSGTAAQRGPLWWAAHHRHHHRHSDQEDDIHSPREHGFWWSHVGWITSPKNAATNLDNVRDFARYPELRFLDRFDNVMPIVFAVGMYLLGAFLGTRYPSLGTSGWQMLVWGFFVSTVVLYHCTFIINSLCHVFGTRRYETTDDSRNNLLFALLTLGEGWHNNHHKYPGAARQGFFWWEIDISYYLLWIMARLGIVWDLNPVPERIKQPDQFIKRTKPQPT